MLRHVVVFPSSVSSTPRREKTYWP